MAPPSRRGRSQVRHAQNDGFRVRKRLPGKRLPILRGFEFAAVDGRSCAKGVRRAGFQSWRRARHQFGQQSARSLMSRRQLSPCGVFPAPWRTVFLPPLRQRERLAAVSARLRSGVRSFDARQEGLVVHSERNSTMSPFDGCSASDGRTCAAWPWPMAWSASASVVANGARWRCHRRCRLAGRRRRGEFPVHPLRGRKRRTWKLGTGCARLPVRTVQSSPSLNV